MHCSCRTDIEYKIPKTMKNMATAWNMLNTLSWQLKITGDKVETSYSKVLALKSNGVKGLVKISSDFSAKK